VTDDVFLVVIINMTHDEQPNTRPVNYTLSASVYVPTTISRGDALWGFRDRVNSSSADGWLKIFPRPEPHEELLILLQVPEGANFDLYVYQKWPHAPEELAFVNASLQPGDANLEYVLVGGSEGNYYIKIDGFDGLGFFVVELKDYGDTIDDDNEQAAAIPVADNDPIKSTIDQGRDKYDWYKINLKHGEEISKVIFRIQKGNWDLYRLSFYNKDGGFEFSRLNTLTGDWPNDENPTTPTIMAEDLTAVGDGDHYVLVTAVQPRDWGPGWFGPASCAYTIEFTLPNSPPEVKATIPKIVMDEDKVHYGPDLTKHFTDPDGDSLTYSLGKQTDDLIVDVDEKTGKVTITPELDWFGTETVIFRATDNGPGKKFVEVECTVRVDPVNDPPRLVIGRTITNLTLNESEVKFTEVLGTVFTDPDNDPGAPLTFKIKLVDSGLMPASAVMPLPFYNSTLDVFEVGPIDFMFGNATFKVTADDNNGTEPGNLPSLTFNITVIHSNHAPRKKEGVADPIAIDLVEGEKDDTLWVYDLVEDNDTEYAGDVLTFEFTDQVNIVAEVQPDGVLVFDTAGSEYYPGQNYVENIQLKVEDMEGVKFCLNFTVTVTPIDDPPVFRTTAPSLSGVTINEGEKVEFKVIVDDNDTPNTMLNFTWFIGKVNQTGEHHNFFTYETDYTSADGLNRTIKVVVTDGNTEISHQWTLRIEDVNRAPDQVGIENPLNASVFKEGKTINFVAQGHDADGDQLTFIWYDGATEIGRGSSFSTKSLKKGYHTVRVEVLDGDNSVNATVVFEVRRKDTGDQGVPGFGTLLAIGAIVTVALVKTMALASRRRRWSP
jgi:hypothetical protein